MSSSPTPPTLKERLLQQIQKNYPQISGPQISGLIAEQLLSPFHVTLEKNVLEQAEAFVKATFQLRLLKSYSSQFAQELQRLNLQEPGNNSILMSYDFHLADSGQLKLIEINTNASFLALSDLMYKVHGRPQPIPGFQLNDIRDNILNELKLNGTPAPHDLAVAIIDDKPEEQKLFAEFLIYAELFKSWGWKAQICDYRQLPVHFDFIYNRTTDFMFSDPSSTHLRELFNSRKITFSPQPIEYIYLADKMRMLEWSRPGFLESVGLSQQNCEIIKQGLPKSLVLNSANAEEIWAQRKNLFFKPFQSYGSKQTYKGSGISKKTFQAISENDFLAQEYIAPSEIQRETPTGPQQFKYDLRFYAYQDRIQSVIARIYQGQLTNLRTPLGGFACVEFS